MTTPDYLRYIRCSRKDLKLVVQMSQGGESADFSEGMSLSEVVSRLRGLADRLEGKAGASEPPAPADRIRAALDAPGCERCLRAVLAVVQAYLPPDGLDHEEAMSRIIGLVDPWPARGVGVPDGGKNG
jgi:hypothetical protein